MNRLIDNPILDSLGFATVISTALIGIGEHFAHLNFNDVVQAVIGVGGIIFLFYKIKNSRIDYKVKKRDYDNCIEEKKKEND
jgi:hypothetical protein